MITIYNSNNITASYRYQELIHGRISSRVARPDFRPIGSRGLDP